MARKVRDAVLDSPTARLKLKAGKRHVRAIDRDVAIVYMKNKAGGRWTGRFPTGEKSNPYDYPRIGTADDKSPADGVKIFDFFQAQARVRALDEERRKPKEKHGPYTVGQALDAYIEQLEAEHKKGASYDARSRIKSDIRPELGDLAVQALTQARIAKWLKELAERPRHVRGKKEKASRPLAAPKTDDERRRRKASANRTLTVLKAALNQAFKSGYAASDVAWRTVSPFEGVEQARLRYFTTDEVKRLVNAASGEFRSLVNAALFTGCRYGELCRMRVGDFNPDSGTILVALSKSGKARHVVLTEEGQTFFKQIAAGKATDALMLAKADGSAWRPSHQIRPMGEACKAAKVARAGFHILRHTAASHNVMSGVPLMVVARNLGHADTRMVERHYGHMSNDFVAETIRKFAPTFGTVEPSNVKTIERAR